MRSAKIQNKSSATYANDRTIARWGDLKMSGKRPVQEYAQYDYDGLGLISCLDFREVSRRLGILQSENQLFAVFNDFSSISDTSMVAYKEFCDALDVLERTTATATSTYGKIVNNEWSFSTLNNFEDTIMRSKNDLSMYNDNDELDPSLSTTNVSHWLKHNRYTIFISSSSCYYHYYNHYYNHHYNHYYNHHYNHYYNHHYNHHYHHHYHRNTHEYNQFQRSYESLSAFKITQRRVIDSDDFVNFNETKSTYRRK
jgi:hypothetical protein